MISMYSSSPPWRMCAMFSQPVFVRSRAEASGWPDVERETNGKPQIEGTTGERGSRGRSNGCQIPWVARASRILAACADWSIPRYKTFKLVRIWRGVLAGQCTPTPACLIWTRSSSKTVSDGTFEAAVRSGHSFPTSRSFRSLAPPPAWRKTLSSST